MVHKSFADYIEALQIFQKYAKEDNDSFVLHSEHDVIYMQADINDINEEADLKCLEELGWHCHDHGVCWRIYT